VPFGFYPDDVVVIHSFRWLHPGNVRALTRRLGAQGEGDFVLFDPGQGVMGVQVEGGRVSVRRGAVAATEPKDRIRRED
jgi:hypothetical protein